MFEDQILPFFIKFAYQPLIVYTALTLIMFASSFGLPIPEEVTLISAGLVVYIAANNPPPYPGAQPVTLYTTAAVAFVAVFLSDIVIYSLGRFFGKKILATKIMLRYRARMEKVSQWVKKYGQWAAGLFRFTPGIRFPGHFSCGMMGLAMWKFMLVDGFAALISVPTQVILVATFGKEIIANIKEFQAIIMGVALILAIGYLLYLYFRKKKEKNNLKKLPAN